MIEVLSTGGGVVCAQYGVDRQAGNLVGIQVRMTAADYALPSSFRTKLNSYMRIADQQGWLSEKSIVIFPEHIGTWLVASDEKRSVTEAESLRKGMIAMALSHPISLLRTLPKTHGRDRLVDALFRMKSRRMADIYHSVFSELAHRYGVTLVAGSIVLPEASVRLGLIELGQGPLFNTAIIYRPDGSPYDELIQKVHPISEELPFLHKGDVQKLSTYRTPAGRLGVLICADSWYSDVYEPLRAQGCDFVAVPNHLTPENVWHLPWKGYSPGPAPRGVDERDVGNISEGEAWLKYALAGKLSLAGARTGMHIFFRGKVWDLGSDGHTIVVNREGFEEGPGVDGAAITNLWL